VRSHNRRVEAATHHEAALGEAASDGLKPRPNAQRNRHLDLPLQAPAAEEEAGPAGGAGHREAEGGGTPARVRA
jgi:hypothetical protein